MSNPKIARSYVVATCSKCLRPNSAKWNCIKCKQILCDSCKTAHGRKSILKTHSFTSVETVGTSKETQVDLTCSCEEKRKVSLLCVQCSLFVCVDCVALKHNGHSFETLENANKIQNNKLTTTITEIADKRIPQNLNMQEEIKICLKRITEKAAIVKDEILSRQADLKAQIDRWTNSLIEELDEFSADEQSKLTDFQAIVLSQMVKLQEEKQRLLSVAESKDARTRLEGVSQSVKDWATLSVPPVNDIYYLPGPDILSNLSSTLGSLSVKEATDRRQVQNMDYQAPSAENGESVSLDDTVDGAFDFLSLEEDESESASNVSVYSTDLVRVTSVSSVSPDMFWIGDLRAQCIQLVQVVGDRKLRTLAKINTRFIDFGVCQTQKSLWISCVEDNCLSVVTLQGKKVNVKNFQPLLPTCVHVTPRGTVMLGLSEKRSLWLDKDSVRKLVVFRPPDIVLLEIERDAQGMLLFTFPLRCSVNQKTDDLLVIDSTGRTSGRLLAFSEEGSLQYVYTGDGSLILEKPFDPTGVTSVSMGNVVVCDYSNHLFHVLDTNGMLLKAVIASELAIEMPYSLSNDGNRNILIGNWPSQSECNSNMYVLSDKIFSSSAVCV